MRLTSLIVALLVLFAAGCNEQTNESAKLIPGKQTFQAPTELAKVKVEQSGEIYLDGRPATIEELTQEFSRLKQVGGGVWYSAEDPSSAQSKAVKQAIIAAQLPMMVTPGKSE